MIRFYAWEDTNIFSEILCIQKMLFILNWFRTIDFDVVVIKFPSYTKRGNFSNSVKIFCFSGIQLLHVFRHTLVWSSQEMHKLDVYLGGRVSLHVSSRKPVNGFRRNVVGPTGIYQERT
jgi:hypothetical protein